MRLASPVGYSCVSPLVMDFTSRTGHLSALAKGQGAR